MWLALAVEAHQHHLAARAWFEAQLDGSGAFCRLTELALLRHLTNSRIMAAAVQSQAQAWRHYETLRADPRVVYLDEPAGLEAIFKSATQESFPGHDRWTDAYLGAFAQAAGLGIVTFDRKFPAADSAKVQVLIS